MTLSLTPSEAQSKIQQIDTARDTAVQKLKSIEDNQQQMLGSNWKGGSATTYANTSATQNDDINQIINNLNHLVDTATKHINTVANADSS